MDKPQPQTWLTIFATTLIFSDRVGYSFFFRHDLGHRSYAGVFKAEITDSLHGEACSLGAAIKAALKGCKDVHVTGITIYTDSVRCREMLQQFKQNGYVSVTDKNHHFVIGLNTLLNQIKRKPLSIQPLKVQKEQWMKAALYRKIKKLQAKTFGRSKQKQ